MKRKLPAYTPLLLALIALMAFGVMNALASSSLESIIQSLGGGKANQVKIAAHLSQGQTIDPSATPIDPSATPIDPSATPIAGDEVKLTGTVVSISADFWMIGENKVVVDALTVIEHKPVVGDSVKVEAILQADGSYLALEIDLVKLPDSTPDPSKTPHPTKTPDPSKTPGGDHSHEFEYSGLVISISPESWVIGEFTFKVDANTKIEHLPVVGDKVKVEAILQADQTYLAKEIDLVGKPEVTKTPGINKELEITGTVESITGDVWVVKGTTFTVDAKTEIEHPVVVGDMVKVEAILQADQTYLAKEIDLVHPKETSEPSKTPKAGKEVKISGKVESIGADSWVINGQTVLVNAKTEIDKNVIVGDEVKVEAILQADNTYLAKEIEKVGQDDDGDKDDDVEKPHVTATPGAVTPTPAANNGSEHKHNKKP
jgi:hypothetical protein